MSEDASKNIGLYILKLNNDKYYVGITRNGIGNRIEAHVTGRGSKWTSLHGVRGIEEIIELDGDFGLEILEKVKTLELMEEHGWENVRGGPWCQVSLSKPRPLGSHPF